MLLNLDSMQSATGTEVLNREIRERSELQLLADAKRGSSDAFGVLCEVHRRRLFAAAMRITRNSEDAEDALQDCLMRAFVHIGEFHGKSSLSTWLTRIVINSALMIRRKNHNSREISADELHPDGNIWLNLQIADESPNPEQQSILRERRAVLRRAVRSLRPSLRAVVEVAQFRELSTKETARVLDISIVAAKGRLFHSRRVLRRSAQLRAVARTKRETAA